MQLIHVRFRNSVLAVFLLVLAVSCRAQEATANLAQDESSSTKLPDAPSPLTQFDSRGSGQRSPIDAFLFPPPDVRRKEFLKDLLGPGAFIGPALQAGFDQAQSLKVGFPPDGAPGPGKHPAHGLVPEWGQGFSGYEKRYASRFGMGLLATSTRYGLGEVLRQDVTYHRCACRGFFPRSGHALLESVVAHTRSGTAIPSVPAFVAPFVASQVAVSAWLPNRYDASDAFRMSRTLYIGLPVKNLISEFTKF